LKTAQRNADKPKLCLDNIECHLFSTYQVLSEVVLEILGKFRAMSCSQLLCPWPYPSHLTTSARASRNLLKRARLEESQAKRGMQCLPPRHLFNLTGAGGHLNYPCHALPRLHSLPVCTADWWAWPSISSVSRRLPNHFVPKADSVFRLVHSGCMDDGSALAPVTARGVAADTYSVRCEDGDTVFSSPAWTLPRHGVQILPLRLVIWILRQLRSPRG
jgi:hypothetical protein